MTPLPESLTAFQAVLSVCFVVITAIGGALVFFIRRDFAARDERDKRIEDQISSAFRRLDGHGRTIVEVQGELKVMVVRVDNVEKEVARLRHLSEST